MSGSSELKIKTVIAGIAKISPSKISSKMDIRKLGIDSLMALELVAAVEKVFKIHIPESRIRNITRVDQVVKLVSDLKDGGRLKKTPSRTVSSNRR